MVVLSALAAGCGRHAEEDAATAGPVVAVRAGTVEVRRFDDAIDAPGQWRSAGEVIVSAPFAGVVDSLGPRPGDVVRAGQALGELVTRESYAALKGATLMERRARDATDRTEAGRALELARRDAVRVPLTAPQAGVVLRRAVEPGAQVAESGEVLAIVPWASIVFEARVPARDAARLRVGQSAQVLEEGRPLRTAVLQRVLPTGGAADQTVLAWFAPGQRETHPTLDQFGRATIEVGPPHRAPAVPDSAVVEDDLTGERRVAVIDSSGRACWTPVTVGATSGGWRELRSPPLPAGTRVVLEGMRGLPDSTRVTWAR
jgi:multidrug efflux pump subunit AcrA (membrane-fusion protein)